MITIEEIAVLEKKKAERLDDILRIEQEIVLSRGEPEEIRKIKRRKAVAKAERKKKAKAAACKRYRDKYLKPICVSVNTRTEPDIILKLASQDAVSTYIKYLIRKDIEENGPDTCTYPIAK